MSNKEDTHHELMTQSSQVWIPASFWHVCFKYSTFGTSQDLQRMQLDPEKGVQRQRKYYRMVLLAGPGLFLCF